MDENVSAIDVQLVSLANGKMRAEMVFFKGNQQIAYPFAPTFSDREEGKKFVQGFAALLKSALEDVIQSGAKEIRQENVSY